MEPEEENIGTLQLGNDYRVLTNDTIATAYPTYRLERGGITVNNPCIDNSFLTNSRYGAYATESNMIKNDKGEMVFPELLFKIVKKNLPGISSIEVDGYINNERLSIINFSSVPSYLVLLNVKFHWDAKNVSTPEKLGEDINTAFSMMHTGIDFIKFKIKRVVVESRNYEKEFFNMFMKK